jgi:hypothetical protein
VPVLRRSLQKAVVLSLPAVLTPATASAVIFYSTGDPAHNTTAPTASLANAGWQYEFSWRGGFLGTPVAPHYFITAAHIDPAGSLGNSIAYQGLTYTNVAFGDNSHFKEFGDLRLYHTDNTFYSFAPMFDTSPLLGTEASQNALVIGRGTQRGNPIVVNSEQKGWDWGASDSVQRWGRNKVFNFQPNASTNDLLEFTFDRSNQMPRHGDSVADEVHVSVGDSGGGIFLQDPADNQWKVSGIIYGLSQYRFTMNGPNITAALYDTGGMYDSEGGGIDESDTDKPSTWYASRVATALSTFAPFLDLNPTWNANASGNWTDTTSWKYGVTVNGVPATGTPPNGVDAIADFRTIISAPVTINVNSARTVGTINFDNPAAGYTLSGSTITLDVSSGNAEINVASGNHTIAAPLTLNDATTFRVLPAASTLSIFGTLTCGSHAITKEGDGTLRVNNLRAGAVTINAGKVVVPVNPASIAGTSKITSLSMTGNGKLDLTSNSLAVNYSGSSPIANVTSLIASGRAGGAWNGNGIEASAAAGSNLTSLGVAEASQVLGITGTQTAVFRGQTVDGTSVLVKYTYGGDANLDGKLNVDDYGQIDFNVNLAGASGWYNGDFNYDGKINVDDYGIIDANVVIQGSQFGNADDLSALSAGVSAVPEPSLLALPAAYGFANLLLRRRRPRMRTV